ncbi:hypothetical protein EYF80_051081 [Liparis tanakae]|uniref:Uncharacterized protein n=1 Tax=Liparis tanakae TaxID=230148 RepID=A0A4Z2FC24_9TELE|nr:hypothetical protein EYF80_051081 [Liparis tanakae]
MRPISSSIWARRMSTVCREAFMKCSLSLTSSRRIAMFSTLMEENRERMKDIQTSQRCTLVVIPIDDLKQIVSDTEEPQQAAGVVFFQPVSDLSDVTLILSSLEEWKRSSFSLKYSSMHCSSKSWTFFSSSSVMKSSADKRV